jgi:phage terminase small subunit|tara:strand:- start:38 stop:202 length:165 start_codon:yes stop_codon:yes gene_type:complete
MNHEKRILDRTVKAYCRLGNGTLAAKEAGYKKFSFPCETGISTLKKRSAEISED